MRVTQLRFDAEFHVHMWTLEKDLLVVFGTPFTFRSTDGQIRQFNPEQSEELGPLLSILQKHAITFSSSSLGSCTLSFEDGTELHSEPHPLYEAWYSKGSGNLSSASLLCGVGGGSPWG